MQEASFNGTIKVIFYIIVTLYIIKFLARIFLPHLVKKVVEKAGQNFQEQYTNQQQYSNQQQYTNQQQNTSQKSKDEVVIDTSKAKKGRETKKVGEYVDYEEID